MKYMYIKWAGLLGAVLTGSTMIVAGDNATGVGVIAAALSSASIFSAEVK